MNAKRSAAAAALYDRGYFRFADDAVDEITGLLTDLERSLSPQDMELYDEARDLVYLTAAEFALLPALVDPPSDPLVPIDEPITVGREAAVLAALKTDCITIIWPDHAKRGREGYPLRLWDITAFSADVSKLTAVGITAEHPPTEASELRSVVKELEQLHRASPHPLARQVADAGVLQIQGFLWSAKLSLRTLEAGEAVRAAAREFGLTEPMVA